MGDFIEQTAVEQIEEGVFRGEVSPEWRTWGPAGGYVAAIALRAAAKATSFERPISFVCQFLRVARFEPVEIRVESLHGGRRTEALHVSMTQDDKLVLNANVWVADVSTGMEHDFTAPPEVPAYEELPDLRKLNPEFARAGMYRNLDQRPIDWQAADERSARDPVTRGWCRFRPIPSARERFVDAARTLILLDAFSWPATWPLYPSEEPSPWIAPNLDLHVRFHHDSRPHDWLLYETRAEIASEGLIGTKGTLWSPDRNLIGESSSQLFCRPRPERFR